MNRQNRALSQRSLRGILIMGALTTLVMLLMVLWRGPAAQAATPAPTPTFIPPHRALLQERGGLEGVSATQKPTAPAPLEEMAYAFGGGVTSARLQEDRLYLYQKGRIQVYDVTDSAHPQRLNELILSPDGGEAFKAHIFLAGDYLYLWRSNGSGFNQQDVIDVKSDPPRVVTVQEPLGGEVICNAGTIFYFLNRSGHLEIWDWTDPVAPQLLSKKDRLWGGYYVKDAVVQRGYLYVTSDNGFFIIDVSDAEHPRQIGTLDYDITDNGGLAVQGDWAYLHSRYGSLHVIDVSDRAHPQEVKIVSTSGWASSLKTVAVGNRLYQFRSERSKTELSVFDISAPADIHLLKKIMLDAIPSYDSIQLSPEHILYRGRGKGWTVQDLRSLDAVETLWDIQFPSSPTLLARGGPSLIFTAESRMTALIDVSEPLHPRPLWWADLPPSVPTDIVVDGDYFYVSSSGYSDQQGQHDPIISVYHRPDALHPQLLRRLWGQFNAEAGIDARGNLLIGVSQDQMRLRILDVTRFQNAFLYDGPVAGNSLGVVARQGDLLFLRGQDAQQQWRLYQYNIADPAHPRLIGSYHHPENLWASNLLFNGPVAYAAMQETTEWARNRIVTALHISAEQAPVHLAEYQPFPQPASSRYFVQGAIAGNRLLYTNGSQLSWADISNPEQPQFLKLTTSYGSPILVFEPLIYATSNSGLMWWRFPAEDSSMVLDAAIGGGRTYAVAARDDRLLVGRPHRLLVYDTTDPSHPRLVGETTDVIGDIFDIDVQGDVAYLALGEKGVQVVDVSDPAHPRPGASGPAYGFVWNVDAAGQQLYAADEKGLAVYDISDTARLQLLTQTPQRSWDVAATHDLLASGHHNAFTIAQFTPPDEMRQIYYTPKLTEGVDADNDAFYAAQGFRGLGVYNLWGSLNQRFKLPGYALDVAVQGDQAYVADWLGALHRTDLGDVNAEQMRTTLLPGRTWQVSVAGDAAYVSMPDEGVTVIDAGRMEPIGEIPFKVLRLTNLWLQTVDVVMAGGDMALYRFDLRDETLSPLRLALPASLNALSGRGDMAYAGAGNELLAVETTGPALTIASSLTFSEPVRSIVASAQQPYLYVQTGDASLHLLALDDPARPTEIGRYWTTENIQDYQVIDGALVLATDAHHLQIIDWRDPAHPELSQIIDTPASPRLVASDGRYLAVWESGRGFEVFDVSDPLHPVYLFAQAATEPLAQLLMKNGRLDTLSVSGAVSRYQISPTTREIVPLDVGLKQLGWANRIAVANNMLLAATETGGLQRYSAMALWLPLMTQK